MGGSCSLFNVLLFSHSIFIIDTDINGKEFLHLSDVFALQLGYTARDAMKIVEVVKSFVRCYEIRAKYLGAKKKKGIQATIYRHAENHRARYSLENSIMKVTAMIWR